MNSTTVVPPADDPPLIARANARFSSSFRQTVRSVLRDASVASLRRTMSRRVRESMTRPPPPEVVPRGSSRDDAGRAVDDDDDDDATSAGEEPTTGRMRMEDPRSILEVSYEDIEACHRLAGRVGRMWAEVLRSRGYVELAGVASSVAGEGRFLGEERKRQVGSPTFVGGGATAAAVAGGGRGRRTTGGGYATTHAAARSIRRRPPDCDGSGLPSGRLPASSDCDDDDDGVVVVFGDGTGSPSREAASGDAGRSSPRRSGGSSASARGAIRRIDDMVRNGMAHWEYGWDAIEEAVARNGERIDYSRVAAARSSGVDDVADEGGGSRGNEGAGRRKRGRCDGRRRKAVRFENDGDIDDADGDDEEDDARGDEDADGGIHDVNVSTSANGKSKRRRGPAGQEEAPPVARNVCDESNFDGAGASDGTDGRGRAAFGELEGGRPPSSIGQETFRWDDLVEEMTTEERRRLILSAIHPPHPFESEMDGGAALDDARFDAIVCGALKEVGETHLWEQTRRFSASDDDGGGGGGEGEISEGEEHAVVVPNRYGTEGGRGTALYGVSEARVSFRSQERARRRKRAMARATRERLGRRIASINEHRASYAKAVACSKVGWTEDDVAHLGMETLDGGIRSADSTLPPRGGRPRKWLEMDLGECTIELVDGEERAGPVKDGGGGGGEGAKRFLAFRSLEVALMN